MNTLVSSLDFAATIARPAIVIVVTWGLSLLPFGSGVPTALTVACGLLLTRRRGRRRAMK